MEARACENCGGQVFKNFNFCPDCGHEVPEESEGRGVIGKAGEGCLSLAFIGAILGGCCAFWF